MNKIFFTGRVKEINPYNRSLVAYASTGDIDRDNEIIMPEAWSKTIQEFKSVPLLWAHVYNAPPVGRAGSFEIDEKGLKFSAIFADTDFAEDIWKLYQDGFLDSFSVGFMPKAWEDGKGDGPKRTFTEAELLEISAVPVPANPHATVERDSNIAVFSWKSIDSLNEAQEDYDIEFSKPYPNEHACRLRNPDDFEPGSFRRVNRESDGKKYAVIMGKLKGEDTMTEQAYRYSKDSWSVEEARKHCKSHNGIAFEPAQEINEYNDPDPNTDQDDVPPEPGDESEPNTDIPPNDESDDELSEDLVTTVTEFVETVSEVLTGPGGQENE